MFEDIEDFDLKHDEDRTNSHQKPAFSVARRLKDIDLGEELAKNYEDAQSFLNEIRYDVSVEANKKAQVMNTIQAILKEMIKQQESIHNIERVKIMEHVLIATLKKFPGNLQDQFLDAYERALNA